MAYVILSLLIGVFSLLYLYLRHHYTYWRRHGIPCDEPTLLLGNLKDIGRKTSFREFHKRYYQKYKGQAPFVGMYFFTRLAAVVMDLDLIKNVLIKDFSNFTNRGTFHNVKDDPLTGHLFTLEGEPWRAMRTKLTPVFTSGKMKFMFPTLVNVGDNLVKCCLDLLKNADTLEVKDLCARYTTDVIGTCAFGIDCNSLQDANAEFRQQGRLVNTRHRSIVRGFMVVYPRLAQALHMKMFPDAVSEFFIDAVRRTLDYRIKNNVKRNDFIDLMIEIKAKNEETAQSGAGIDLSHGLTTLQIAAQAFVFFFAGFETSATTMSFMLYEMALNKDIQNKVRAEIKACLAKHNGELSYDCVKEMKYLEMVLSETLRKYPILSHLQRQSHADYCVPGTNYVIPAGVLVLIPIAGLHFDPEIYPEPEKFDPERFTAEAIQARHPCAYMPFGDGPRNCIGARFGRMQTKIGIIKLLQNFKFTKSEHTQVPLQMDPRQFLTTSKGGIPLNVERI